MSDDLYEEVEVRLVLHMPATVMPLRNVASVLFPALMEAHIHVKSCTFTTASDGAAS